MPLRTPSRSTRPLGWSLIAAAFGVLAVSFPVAVPSADAATLYRICHRTNAIKNPYRSIRVAWSALGPSDGTRHRIHDGIVFDVVDPEGTHANTPRDEVPGGGNERWGDIFSHTKGTTRDHNWTTEGEAIYNGATFQLSDGVTRTACKSMSIQEFVDSELEAGVSLEDIMTDLDDQESSEDLAVKNALGGSFSSWFAALPPAEKNAGGVSAGLTAATPTVVTDAATDVTGTSATLPGSSDPQGTALTFRFEYSTDPGLAGASSWDASMTIDGTPGTSSSSSSSVPVASPLTGLTPGTTYYFELVGTSTSGSGDSEVSSDIRGGIKSFTTPAATTTTTSTTTTTTTSTTTTTVSSGGGGGGGPATTSPPAATTSSTTTSSTTSSTVPSPSTTVLARVTPLECSTLDPRPGAGSPVDTLKVSANPSKGEDPNGTLVLTQPTTGPALEVVGATSSDPTVTVTVTASGADYNKPSTWEAQGFGQECWKIEPFGDGDYRYLLPLTPQPPSGRTPAYYSMVKVKAGSITSTDPNFQVNTVFPTPAGGSVVFADSNGDGVSNPGGRNGDKSISHVIICVIYGERPAPVTPATTVPATTVPAPTLSSTTSTPATLPTVEPCPTLPTVPTTTPPTVPGSPSTTAPGSSGTTVPGSTGTTVPGSPSTTTPGSSGTTVPGSSGTTVPGGSGSTVPGSPSTTAPGSSGTTVPGSTGTTVPGGSGSTVPGSPSTTSPGSSGTTVPGSSVTTTPGSLPIATPTTVASSPLRAPMRLVLRPRSATTTRVITVNVKLSDGFRQYSMPIRLDVRTFKVQRAPLPVSGGTGVSPQLFAAALLLLGAAFLGAGRRRSASHGRGER